MSQPPKSAKDIFLAEFRIKIWDRATNTIVYDNQPDEADDSNEPRRGRGNPRPWIVDLRLFVPA